jgi:hypothetical protein
MSKTHGASDITSDARRSRRSDWRATLIVAPLLAASLAANALIGMAAAPQVVNFLSHATPASHSVLASIPVPSILGGPDMP